MTEQTPLRHYAASSEDECPWCELDGDRNAHTDPEYGQGTECAVSSVAEVGEDDGWPALLCWCGHSLHLPDCLADLGEADTCAARFRYGRPAVAPTIRSVRRGPADAEVDMLAGPGWVLARAEAEAAGLIPARSPWVRRAESGTLPPDAHGARAYETRS